MHVDTQLASPVKSLTGSFKNLLKIQDKDFQGSFKTIFDWREKLASRKSLNKRSFQASSNIFKDLGKIFSKSLKILQDHRPLSHGGHFESQGNKRLCFCPSSLALDERLDGQNLLFQHCVIKVY